MRIDSSGKVGIGIAAPARNLHLAGSSGSTMAFTDDTTGHTSDDGTALQQYGTTHFQIWSYDAPVQIATGGEVRFEIANNGNTTFAGDIEMTGDRSLKATGDLKLYADGVYMADWWTSGGSYYAKFRSHATVDQTLTVTGDATFAGHVLSNSHNSSNLGSSGVRWANLYVADVQMSNEGSGGNEIDGTEGSWTIQEGEEDLFLLNRKNGKKYKFKLEEM